MYISPKQYIQCGVKKTLYVFYTVHVTFCVQQIYQTYGNVQSGNPPQMAALQAWTLHYTAHVRLRAPPTTTCLVMCYFLFIYL